MIKRITLGLPLLWTSITIQSAGFAVAEHSASGQGRAFAGEAAVADTAAVVSHNPAAMTRFKKTSVSAAFNLIIPQLSAQATGQNQLQQTAESLAPNAFLPSFAMIKPLTKQWRLGISSTSNYGVTSSYPKSFIAGTVAGKTSLTTCNLNPNLAYQINDAVSVGGGMSLIFGKAYFNRRLGTAGNPSDQLMSYAATAAGWGWNLGVLYNITPRHRLGLSFRSQTDLAFSGDFTDYSGLLAPEKKPITAQANIPLPAIIEFSGYHQLNTDLAFHYSALWTQWDHFTSLKATSGQCYQGGICMEKAEDYHNTIRYAVGSTYQVSPEWVLRTGFAFDPHAGQSTLSIPEMDRYWYSLGASYQQNEDFSVDLAISYIHGKANQFNDSLPPFQRFQVKVEGYAVIAALQFNYKI